MTQVELKARCNPLLCFGDHKIAFDIKDTLLKVLQSSRCYDSTIILATTGVSPALSPKSESMTSRRYQLMQHTPSGKDERTACGLMRPSRHYLATRSAIGATSVLQLEYIQIKKLLSLSQSRHHH
jgi:hypothetical protein